MEISNPIASQYVMNQGLAAQLTTPNAQLPIKSERFTTGNPPENNKVPAPTEEEQNLRSEKESQKQQNTPELLLANEQSFLPKLNLNSQHASNSSPVPLPQQNNQISTPIQSYLETSSLATPRSEVSSRVDFFV
jgi:hypothetical protein